MNRWSGTGHLTKDPELTRTPTGTEICLMRIAVDGAGKDFAAGYFELKAFNAQASACAEHLQAGREIAVDGRLRFEEWRTVDDQPRSRVWIAADRVEFLSSRSRRDGGDGRRNGEGSDFWSDDASAEVSAPAEQ